MTNGELITVCEYVEFNHSFLAAGGSAQEVAVLAPAIGVPGGAFIGGSVSVHARTISATAPAGYEVIVRPTHPSRRDPAEFQYLLADAVTPKIGATTEPGCGSWAHPALVADHRDPASLREGDPSRHAADDGSRAALGDPQRGPDRASERVMAATRHVFGGSATDPRCSCLGSSAAGVRGDLPGSPETHDRTAMEREWLGFAAVASVSAARTQGVRSFASSAAVDAKSATDECGLASTRGAQKPAPAHRKMLDESPVRPLPRDHWLQGTIIRRRGGGAR